MNRNLPGLALACAVLAATAAPTRSLANLLANPGFESGGGSYAGWITFGAGVQLSHASGDNIVHSGIEASKIYGEFTGCPIPNFDVGGYLQTFPPTPGMEYVFSGFSYISNADVIPAGPTCAGNRCVAKLAFFNAVSGGTEISGNEIVIGDGNMVLNQWVPFSVTALAPAGALRVEALILFLQPGCDGGAVYVDDLSLLANSPPIPGLNLLANPSFDTTLTGWTVFGNVYQENRGNTLPQFAFARRTPPGAAKMYSTFVLGSDSGMYQSFAASAGSEWKFELYSLNSCEEDPIDGTSDNVATAKIVFLNGTGTEIGSAEQTVVNATSPKGTWTRHTVVGRAPTGTAQVRPYILFISPSLLPGDACFIDDASFAPAVLTDAATTPRPLGFELGQNVPNPFRQGTTIDFSLSRPGLVELAVFDVAGRRVATLLEGPRSAGSYSASWDGKLTDGTVAASGIYQYRLKTSEGQTSRRMIRIK